MKHGYTLIEILVVLAIIGILAAITTISYRTSLISSRDARRKSDLEQIRGALELYRSYNNSYPASLSIACAASGGLSDANATYLSTIPKDPKCSTQTYYYTQLSSGADYTLGALLEIPGSSSCGNCLTSGSQACNYCVGPYGQK